MRGTFHPSILFTVTTQEHQNQPKLEMRTRVAVSRFWCVAQYNDFRCIFTRIRQVLSGKVPCWWILEECCRSTLMYRFSFLPRTPERDHVSILAAFAIKLSRSSLPTPRSLDHTCRYSPCALVSSGVVLSVSHSQLESTTSIAASPTLVSSPSFIRLQPLQYR